MISDGVMLCGIVGHLPNSVIVGLLKPILIFWIRGASKVKALRLELSTE